MTMKIPTCVALPIETKKALLEEAYRQKVTQSEICRQALQDFLKL